jgi:hypothetical protein
MYTPHALLQIGGFLGTSEDNGETFSFGLRFVSGVVTEDVFVPSPASSTATAAWLAAAQSLITTWFRSNDVGISEAAKLTFIKFNNIDGAGHYLDSTLTQYVPEGFISGGGEARWVPFQVSRVVTLETGVPRGKARRGRVYLPVPTDAVDEDGKSTLPTNFLTVTSVFIAALNALPAYDGFNFSLAVMSKGSSISLIPAEWHLVNSISCTNVLDTQRRRMRQLNTARTGIAV